MREIKFRAQGRDNGKFYFGFIVIHDSKPPILLIPKKDGTVDRIFVRPESIGQFTGLKDKNGKEIYEGDIITSYMFHNNEPYMVELDDIFWQIGEGLIAEEYVEILGNIHENPELLKCAH